MADRKMILGIALVALAACGPASIDNADPGNSLLASTEAVITLPVPATSPTNALSPSPEADFATFWVRFRTAVLAADAATIRALSAPVVEQRGELDSTPIIKLSPAQVPAVIAAMAVANSEAEALSATTPAPRPDTNNFARFENFEFGRGPTDWQLTAIYFEPGME